MRSPFFICTSARSGSFFFMSLLNATGKTQYVKEHLWHARGLETDEEILSYWRNIGVNLKKIWGTKIDVRDLRTVERYLSIKKVSPSSIKWIWLRRRDKINQAISHCRALRTDIWHLRPHDSEEKKELAKSDMEIPVDELNQFALLYFFVDTVWERFFETNNIEPYTLFYEDFIEESEWMPTVAGVLDFLEIPYTLPIDVFPSQIKQSPDTVSVNYERFIDYNYDAFKQHKYERHFWKE